MAQNKLAKFNRQTKLFVALLLRLWSAHLVRIFFYPCFSSVLSSLFGKKVSKVQYAFKVFFCVHIVVLRLPEATLSVETDAKVTHKARYVLYF